MCRIKSLKLLILVVTVYIVQIFCIVLPEGYGGSSGNVIAFDQSAVLASDDIHLSKLQLNINHGRALIKAQQQQHQNYHHKHRSKQLLEVQKLQQEAYSKSYDKNNDFIVRAGIKNRSQKNDTFTGKAIEKTRLKRQLSDLLIVPNTHWCGRGNSANGSYIRLGGALADKCCRRHDNCQLYIPGLSNRYDLFNYRPYTLSHCNCDLRFHTCLKLANDDDAKTIGKLFFNVVQTQCFVLRTARVCQQRTLDGTCTQEVIKHKAHLQNNKRF